MEENTLDVTRTNDLNPSSRAVIDDMFEYHPWTPEQIQQGGKVRAALAEAFAVIIENVPASPDRSAALRKIREARMDANSAITHRGKY